MNLTELGGSLQKIDFQLATTTSCYKLKVARHEKKQQTEIHYLKKQQMESTDRSNEKMLELHKQVMDFEEKNALAESKSTHLGSELVDLKSDLEVAQTEWDTQKTMYEERIKSLELLIAELKDKNNNMEDQMDAEYNFGLAFCYKYIMFVLKKEYPELDMCKLEAGVNK